MKVKGRTIDIFSIAWLAMGQIVFLLGWCRYYYSVPLTILIIYCMVQLYRRYEDSSVLELSASKAVGAAAIIVVMMILCGIGGYVVQPNDHFGRNAIFTDTWRYDWPVYDAGENLFQCYYLAFWMVPALVGKLFHSLDVGFFTQLIWLSIGFFLLFLQICRYMGKVRISYLFFFYLFAGLKVVESFFYFLVYGHGNIIGATLNVLATNGSPGVFHAGPMVQLLYDPFNQSIPLFIGMMLMFQHAKSRLVPFVYALLLLYAPFPFAGLAPIVLYWWLSNLISANRRYTRELFCIENITALALIIVSALYLLSNINGSHRGIRPSTHWAADVYAFVLYVVFEFLLYLWIGYRACKDKTMLWIVFVSTCCFGWFQIGLHNDFCFRSNMPFIFILALLVMKRYYMIETRPWMKKIILACFIVGGIPAQIHPDLRLLSSYYIATHQSQLELNQHQHFIDVSEMYIMRQTKMRNDDLKSTFHCGNWGWMCDSFKGRPDSFFFKYIAQTIE